VTRAFAIDVAIGLLLATITGAASFERSGRIHPVAFQYVAGGFETSDIWFDADLPKMACLMSDRQAGQHSITTEHPLISLLAYAPTRAVRAIAGTGKAVAIRVVVAIASATWAAMLFTLLRVIGCRAIDAALFTLLGIVSAAGMFWMAVPESFLPGAITLLLPLWAAVRARRESSIALASAASLSVTITNWIAGLALAATALPRRRAVQVSANALVIVSALWFVQSWLFPENVYFLGSSRAIELAHNERPQPLQALVVMLSHSMVMPSLGAMADARWRGLTVQSASPAHDGAVAVIAVILWAAVLIAGARSFGSGPAPRAFRIVCLVTLAAQSLHLVFGKETFLYVPHIMTLLIVVAAHGVFGRFRTAILAMAMALIVAAGVNNWRQFGAAAAFVQNIGDEAAGAGATFEIAGACQ
jgi:hypothetical protein